MKTLQEIKTEAKNNGVSLYSLGCAVWGEKSARAIYILKNPTTSTLQRIDEKLQKIIKKTIYK